MVDSVRWSGLSTLSIRQRQVMELAAQGLSSQAIARRLGLRFYTVTSHLKRIYRKLGVHNRAGAVSQFCQTQCPQCGCSLADGL